MYEALGVRLVWECEQMEDGKDGHFDAKKQGRYSDFQIWVCDLCRWRHDLEGGRCENTDYERLPEGEEDHELDCKDLQEGSVWCKVLPKLNVELDDHVHGDGNSDGFYNLNLLILAWDGVVRK